MLFRIARINWYRVPRAAFITLTYPDAYYGRPYRRRSSDRYLFQRHLEKHLGKQVAILWRTEWQLRKTGQLQGCPMPHVHLLVFTDTWIPYNLVNHWWQDILGTEGYVRTDTRGCNNGWHAAKYVAKYQSKPDSGSLVIASYLNNEAGRSWGITRQQLIPWWPEEAIDGASPDLVVEAFLAARPHLKPEWCNRPGSFTLLGEAAEEVFKHLQGKALTNRRPPG